MNAISQLANQMTQIKADKNKERMMIVLTSMVIILLDIFVYDYTKTSMRSMSSLVIIFILLKTSKKISFTKVGIQMLMITVLIIIADTVLQIGSKFFLTSSLNTDANFTVMYGLMLLLLNLIWLTMNKFNISFINLNKSKL
jgi:cell shape-determining protein MreD